MRKYITISAGLVLCLFAVGLWCWSPQASIDKRLSVRDSLLLRLAVRAHTLLPIYEIAAEGNDMASVIAGGIPPWVHIPKDYASHGADGDSIHTCYYFQRTMHGWRFSSRPPPSAVDFGVDPPSTIISGAILVAEFVALYVLSLFWSLRKESRWQIRVAAYVWLGFLVLSCVLSLSMPTHYYLYDGHKPMSADTYSYYITVALIGLVFGLSLPAIVAGIIRCMRSLRRCLQILRGSFEYGA
jgi:hypothetical protein